MKPLLGHRVVAFGGMAERPLARYLRSLGAEIESGEALKDASFLIDDLGLERLADAGWTRARIEAENPALIHVSVTAFGSGGPRSLWRGGELVASAMGGALRLSGALGKPPLKEALDACTFHADMIAASGALAAHYSRGATGQGQHVDVSIQEAAFGRNVTSIVAWQFDRRKLFRVGQALNFGKAIVRCVWRLADGWCFHVLMPGLFGAPANEALTHWIDEAGLDNPLREVNWKTYNRSTLDPAVRAVWEKAIAAFFLTRTKAEIAAEGLRRGVNACVIASPADVLAEPHLRSRGYWAEEGGLRRPSRFTAFREGPDAPKSAERKGDRAGPLSGVRVLDFSWALVGSITTKTLGDLGADVIKVESESRPCLSRLDTQVSVSKVGNFNDKPWFAHLNTSKRSLALDMKKPESWEVLGPLIEWADVVVENFSPGTMAKLGLDYDKLLERNPGIVMVSGSVYGQTGPLAREWGVDGTGAALSSRTYLTGWPGGDEVFPSALPYGDVIVPYVMAASVAAALQHRRETGRGCHIDASMYEICVEQMTDAILAEQTGPKPSRMGNGDARALLQDVFPAKGEDRWVAISVWSEQERERLYELAGGRDIARWTATCDENELVALLQAAGIAAGAAQDIEDLIARDPEIAARGALTVFEHPHLGPFGHIRTPIDFSRDRVVPYRAPDLGEHSVEIVRDVARLDEDRAQRLEEQGVLR